MSQIRNISQTDFEAQKLIIDGYCIVECYRNLYGPLQIMEPVLRRLRAENDIQFSHLRINTKENPFVVDSFYVLTFPSY